MKTRLQTSLGQQLVLTPQLQQAIKLLALSNLEIEGFIAEEIERNPLLEAGAAQVFLPGTVSADAALGLLEKLSAQLGH